MDDSMNKIIAELRFGIIGATGDLERLNTELTAKQAKALSIIQESQTKQTEMVAKGEAERQRLLSKNNAFVAESEARKQATIAQSNTKVDLMVSESAQRQVLAKEKADAAIIASAAKTAAAVAKINAETGLVSAKAGAIDAQSAARVSLIQAQEAKAQATIAESEAKKFAITAKGEAEISAITAKEALTRQAIVQKETATELIAVKSRVEQEKLLYMQARKAAFESSPTGLAGLMERRLSWLGTGALVMGGTAGIAETISTIDQVEAGMTTIARVTEDAAFSFKGMRDELQQLGVDYASTWENTSDIAIRWAQAGYNMNDTLELTKDSLLALNTAELNSEQATNGMIAIMSQWGLTADQLLPTIDKINKVSDDYAVTSQDLVDGLSRSSGAAKVLGLTMNETIAILTTMREATGRSGKEVGNALNSILSFMQRDKAIDVFESSGIQVFADKAKTEFRNVINIFDEMAAKWPQMGKNAQDTLTSEAEAAGLFSEELANAVGVQGQWNDMQQRDLSQAAAGVYRRNFLLALLQNWSKVNEVLISQENSLGYSMKENERTMQTLDKQYEALKASAEQLAVALGDAGLLNELKGLVDGLSDGVQRFNNLDDSMQTALLTVAEVTLAVKLLDIALKSAGVSALLTGGTKVAGLAALGVSFKTAAKDLAGITAAAAGAKAAIGTFGRGVLGALGGPVGIALITVGTGLGVIAREASRASDELQAHATMAEGLVGEYDSLAAKLDGMKQGTDEYTQTAKELRTVKDQIAENLPEVIDGYNKETGSLEINRKAMDDIITAGTDLKKSKEENGDIYDASIKKLEEERQAHEANAQEYESSQGVLTDLADRRKELTGVLAKQARGSEEAKTTQEALGETERLIADIAQEAGLKRNATVKEIMAELDKLMVKEKEAAINTQITEAEKTQAVINESYRRLDALSEEIKLNKSLLPGGKWYKDIPIWQKGKYNPLGELWTRLDLKGDQEEAAKVNKELAKTKETYDKQLGDISKAQNALNNLKADAITSGTGGPPDTGSGGSSAAEAYTEAFKQYIQSLEQNLPVVDDLLAEHNTALDQLGIKQTIWKNTVGDTIPTLAQEREAFANIDTQMAQHRDIQDDLHTTADAYRVGIADLNNAIDQENARYASGKVSAKDHREALSLLLDERKKLQKQVTDNGSSWMREEETLSNLDASIKSNAESTRDYRDSMIKSYKDEIDYLTRDGASQAELSRAYAEQGSYVSLLTQKRDDLNKQILDGEKNIADLQAAQGALNTTTEQGALQYDFYGQAIAEATGKLSGLKAEQIAANKAIEEGNDLTIKNRIAELDKLYNAHMMTLDQYVDGLQNVEDQYGATASATEQFSLNVKQSDSLLSQWTRDIDTALDEAQTAFDTAMTAIDDSITKAQDSLDDFKDAISDVFDAVDSSGSSSGVSDAVLGEIVKNLPNVLTSDSSALSDITSALNPSPGLAGLIGSLTSAGAYASVIADGQYVAPTENGTTTSQKPTELPDEYKYIGNYVKDNPENRAAESVLLKKYLGESLTEEDNTIYAALKERWKGYPEKLPFMNIKAWEPTTTYNTTTTEFLAQMTAGVTGLAAAGDQIDTALSDVSAWQKSEDTRIDNAIVAKQDDLKKNLALLEDLFADVDKAEKKYARETAKNNFDKSYAAAMGIKSTPGITPTMNDLQTLVAGLPGQLDLSTLGNLSAEQFASTITQGLTTLEDAKITAEGYIQDLADSTQAQIDAIDAQLKALEEETQKDTRADAEEAHNKKLAELQKQLAYEQVRTGQEHLENIEDINQQIADENKSWAETQEDYEREDKKSALETQKEKLQTQSDLLTTALNDFVTYINSEISTRQEATEDYKASLQDQTDAEIDALETEKSLVDQKAALLTEMLTDLDTYITDSIAKWKKLADERVDIETSATDAIIANANREKDKTTEIWNANKSAIQSVMQDSTLAQLAMMAAVNGKGSDAIEAIIAMISDSGYKKGIKAALQNIVTLSTPTPQDSGSGSGSGSTGDNNTGGNTGGNAGGTTTPTKTAWNVATNTKVRDTSIPDITMTANPQTGQFTFDGIINGVDKHKVIQGSMIPGVSMINNSATVTDPGAFKAWVIQYLNPNLYARGTNYSDEGWSITGEYGPELQYLPKGSRVIPNSPTMDLLNGGLAGRLVPDLSRISGYLQTIDKLQAQISVTLNSNIDKATDRIVEAIKSRFTIDKAVNIEHYEPHDSTDVDIINREIMRQVGQL